MPCARQDEVVISSIVGVPELVEIREMHFRKVAINVLRRTGSNDNELPGLLRRWFGPDAGRTGTDTASSSSAEAT